MLSSRAPHGGGGAEFPGCGLAGFGDLGLGMRACHDGLKRHVVVDGVAFGAAVRVALALDECLVFQVADGLGDGGGADFQALHEFRGGEAAAVGGEERGEHPGHHLRESCPHHQFHALRVHLVHETWIAPAEVGPTW